MYAVFAVNFFETARLLTDVGVLFFCLLPALSLLQVLSHLHQSIYQMFQGFCASSAVISAGTKPSVCPITDVTVFILSVSFLSYHCSHRMVSLIESDFAGSLIPIRG